MDAQKKQPKPRTRGDHRVVYCMSFRHWRSGKLVFRKDGKPFRFLVKQR